MDSRDSSEVLVFNFVPVSRGGTGINQHPGEIGTQADLSINGVDRLDVIRRDSGHVPMANLSRERRHGFFHVVESRQRKGCVVGMGCLEGGEISL